MEEKLQASVRKYKETLRRVTTRHRQTQLLPQRYTEHPVAQGKRMRLECHTAESEVTKENQPIARAPSPRAMRTMTYTGHGGKTSIHEESMERLVEGIFLNDEIVNIMLQVAYDELPVARREHIQLCDSYMYAQLTRGVDIRDPPEATAVLENNINRVNRYRRNRGPAEKAITLIPVCEEQHWFLLVIALAGDSPKKAQIGVVDSWRTKPRTHATHVLSRYLRQTLGPVEIHTEVWEVITQTNMYDCGLHLIHNSSKLLEHMGEYCDIKSHEAVRKMNQAPCPITREQIRAKIGELTLRADITGHVNMVSSSSNCTISAEVDTYTTAEAPHIQQGDDNNGPNNSNSVTSGSDSTCRIIPKGKKMLLQGNIVLLNKGDKPWVVSAWTLHHMIGETSKARQIQFTSAQRRSRFAEKVEGNRLCYRLGTQNMLIVRLRISGAEERMEEDMKR